MLEVKLLEKARGLGRPYGDRIALFRTAYRGEDRANINNVFMDGVNHLAVATNGHALFASGEAYDANFAGKVIDRKEWILAGKTVEIVSKNEFPDWVQVMPKTPSLVGRFRVPEQLIWHCRMAELSIMLTKHEVVIGEKFEVAELVQKRTSEKQDLRLLNADYLASISGRVVYFFWQNDQVIAPAPAGFTPVVFVPDQAGFPDSPFIGDEQITKEVLLSGKFPWFSVIMPMRP